MLLLFYHNMISGATTKTGTSIIYAISLFKKLIQFLECSWNHEYFMSLARRASLLLQQTRSIHDSLNIPKI